MMHPALQIEGVLRIIANHLEASSHSFFPRRTRTDLLSMALTCSHFHRPAIGCVWHTLRSFAPILHCLPSDAMSKSDQGFVGPHRPLAPDDWNRVLAMSGFVKSLLIHNVYSPVEILSLQVISAHLNLPTTTLLFPNLQYISWDGPLQNISAYCLNSFMGSALEEAHIRAVNDFEMAFFIQILSQNALSLKKCSFTITPGPGTPDSSKTNATLEKAGHLYVERSEDTPNLPYENINDLFPSLTTLDISLAHSSKWAIPFLHTCRIPKLTTITVRYVRYPWLSDMLSTVKALSSYDSLRKIDLHCIDSPASVPSQLLAPETVKPLLRCSSLRILRIRAETSCGLDDNVLEDIGRALPHLSHLSLSICHNLGNVTYRGLHALAIHCPHLAEVKVPLRFTNLANDDLQSPRRLPPCLSLKKIVTSLDDCGSPDDLTLVALVFFTTFPEVKFGPQWKFTNTAEIYVELNRILGMFRLAQLQVS